MISKQVLLDRIEALENNFCGYAFYRRIDPNKPGIIRRVERLEGKLPITLRVPVVDENGDYVTYFPGPQQKYQDISFEDVCKALQDMCNIEITYQEIKGSEGVVIYEKDDG